MKQNDWTSQLRERLADKQASVPDDLWDKIEHQLSDQMHAKPKRKPMHTLLWVASAAAVALLLIMIGHEHNTENINTLARHTILKRDVQHNVSGNNVASVAAMVDVCDANGLHNLPNECVAMNVATDSTDIKTEAYTNDVTPTSEITPTSEATSTSEASVGESTKQYESEKIFPNNTDLNVLGDYYAQTQSKESRFSIGVSTGGAFVDGRSSHYPAMALVANNNMSLPGSGDGIDYDFNRNVYMLLAAKYKETTHHSQPLTFGLSASFKLMPRLSIATGVVYTRASSDFVSSSGSDEVVSEQRLHYIGVPLSFRYNVWGNHYIQSYGIAGVQADFNVKATMSTSGIKNDIDKDRVQWSAGLAAGLQYNIVPHVGLYVEPGVRYYFDNRSQVKTIYKDKPWAFNLQMGLRFDL